MYYAEERTLKGEKIISSTVKTFQEKKNLIYFLAGSMTHKGVYSDTWTKRIQISESFAYAKYHSSNTVNY